MTEAMVHPTAFVEEGAVLGSGVRIWNFAHVRTGAVIGDRTRLGMSTFVDESVRVGRDCGIQNFVSVYRGVTLEDEVFVGPSVTFTNDRYPRAVSPDWELVETLVRRGASLGANCTVLCGVTIGEWAMVGSGAVVTRDVESHQLVMGCPARAAGWVCWCGRPVPEKPVERCASCSSTQPA
jgi:acetyltransferase-like isoleucine patch superfamily enzyme